MRKALLDTDILSEILKRKDPIVLQGADEYSKHHQAFTLSAVSVHEVGYGLIGKRAERQLREERAIFRDNEIVVPALVDFERAAMVEAELAVEIENWRDGGLSA